MELEFIIGKKENIKNNNYNLEKEILENWIKIFDKYNKSNFSIIEKSTAYTTLTFYNYDLIRLKYSNNSKWIKLFLTKEDKLKHYNNPLFDAQSNKNELFWKAYITNTNDINNYISIIENRCNEILNIINK